MTGCRGYGALIDLGIWAGEALLPISEKAADHICEQGKQGSARGTASFKYP